MNVFKYAFPNLSANLYQLHLRVSVIYPFSERSFMILVLSHLNFESPP